MGILEWMQEIMVKQIDMSDTPAAGEVLQFSGALNQWVAAAIATGAPTDATYLVTTANASLTAEVVVSAYPFVNADIAALAAIAYSKLNLTGLVVDGDIAAAGITTRSKLPSAIVYDDEANTYGAFAQTFRSSNLLITNPANTFNYTIIGSAILAARNLTIPLLTADETIAVLALAQTLTNKTFALGSNTLSGTTAQFNTALTDNDFATLAGTETLTNKTIDGDVNTLTDYGLFFLGGLNASDTGNTIRYRSWWSNIEAATETNTDTTIDYNIRIRRLRVVVTGNTKDGATIIGFRDDAVTTTSVSITALTTGEFDSGTVNTSIASGSLIDWILDRTASTTGSMTAEWHSEFELD